jgi:hypothetical protein
VHSFWQIVSVRQFSSHKISRVRFGKCAISLRSTCLVEFFVSIASLKHRERFAPPPPAAPDLPVTQASMPADAAASSLRGAWLLPLAVLAISILWTIAWIVPLVFRNGSVSIYQRVRNR